jgi:hypothetical protein
MTAPSYIRRWRTRLSDAQANRLRVKLAAERDRSRALEKRVADLQHANETACHELSIERGAVCLKANCPWCPSEAKDGAA